MTDFNPLGSAMRNNLIALSKVQRLIDDTTKRLATGLDVSSALDDPQNFFAARALDFRARDLSRRLDGIGQSIRTLQEADHGIEASLDLLDLAESYLDDILNRYNTGDIELVEGAAENVTEFRPSAADFVGYAGSQDAGGSVNVTNGGNDFTLSGNLWKRALINYTITPDTVLEFEYASTLTPEIVSVGFDNDNNFTNDSNRFFIDGTQFSGITYAAPIPTYQYSGGGAYESYEIPIGAFFTGSFDYITFINDDDSGPTGNSMFRNVFLREGPIQNALVPSDELEEQYAAILEQLDMLVEDAHYRGIGLLSDENLRTIFNEEGSSTLLTEGIDGSSAGLGLLRGDLNSVESVLDELDQVRKARQTLRGYGSSIASDLNIIKTRKTFTDELVNILRKGRDDLTVADQNREGASLLALQTRQALAQTSLSLAGQSGANVLNLFA